MLSDTSKLYFPKLVYKKTVKLRTLLPIDENTKTISLYTLDWSRKEKKCSPFNTDTDTDMYQYSYIELNAEYESQLLSQKFAISDSIMKEIRRCSREAVNEWNIIRNIDKSLNYIYFQPAVSYVKSAFDLLSYCLYDEKELYYSASYERNVYMLLFKFWKNQCLRDLMPQFIYYNDLINFIEESEKLLSCHSFKCSDSSYINKFKKFAEFANNDIEKGTNYKK